MTDKTKEEIPKEEQHPAVIKFNEVYEKAAGDLMKEGFKVEYRAMPVIVPYVIHKDSEGNEKK